MPDAAARWPTLAVAAVAALAGALAGTFLEEGWRIAASAALAAAMAAITYEDLRSLRVPDLWNLFAAVAGLAAVWFNARAWGLNGLAELGRSLIDAALCGGVFLLLREVFYRLRKTEGLGLGDVKLAATGGIWLGWETFALAVAIAAFAALLFIAADALRSRGWQRERRIPLAVFLAPAIFGAWYFAARAPLA
jgi:leader peptidase (prepilin peptidase)/N-methyltransferase